MKRDMAFIVVVGIVCAILLLGAYAGNRAALTIERYINSVCPAVYETDALEGR